MASATSPVEPLAAVLGGHALGDSGPEDAGKGVGDDEAWRVCSRIFAVRPGASLAFLGLRRLPEEAAADLLRRGFCFVDGFVEASLAAALPAAAEASLAAWLEEQAAATTAGTAAPIPSDEHRGTAAGDSDGSVAAPPPPQPLRGLRWTAPVPREARGDHIVSLQADDEAAGQEPLRSIIEALNELLGDLDTLAVVAGEVEMQLAWYPGGSQGYVRHTDAEPEDDCSASGRPRQRRFTAICYCSSDWQPGHGGELRLWPPGAGGGSLDIEPRAGRLALFLSGCVSHEVQPNARGRVALTMWVR